MVIRRASPPRLTAAEQRVLASFLAGRLPAGQLHAELLRAREVRLAAGTVSAPSLRTA
jgi:hypothetical protein